MPADVCIPDGFTDIAVDYFDDYSWRAFIALVWPGAAGHRGEAQSTSSLSAGGPRVFDTYKALWEIFHSDGSAPEPTYDRYDSAANNPCGVVQDFGDITVGSASGIDDIGQAGIGMLDPPVVAQNGRYVRTLTFFNQIAFDHIVRNRFYLRSALPQIPSPRPEVPVIQFPIGSVAVKTAWIDVSGLPPSLVKRLYTRIAMVKHATGTGCSKTHVYQRLLAGTPWQFYRLVMMQWPRLEGNQGRRSPSTDFL